MQNSAKFMISVWNPERTAAEQPLYDTDLISHYKAESETDEAGNNRQALAETFEAFAHKAKCRRNAHSNKHHSSDGARAEYEQVSNCPVRVADGRQN